MADLVLNLRDGRPIWALPDWAVEEIRAALPEGSELYVAEPTADGSPRPSAAVLDAVQGARAYIGFGIPADVLRAGGDTLEWVHTAAAGVGSSLHDEMRTSRAHFTNSAGIHGPPMAETVVGMLLYFARGFDLAVDAKTRRQWDQPPFLAADSPVRELAHMTVGILGYGGIGREVGRRLRALGTTVLGHRRSRSDVPEDELGVQLLHGEDGLGRLLSESDALVVAAPDTPETRGLLSADRIRTLPRGAVVVNVARGSIVDEDALLEALRDGHLRGAGLDVFTTEPLPSDHPFWGLPNVFVLPHTSPITRGFWRRQTDLILENLRRLRAGDPLVNEVDRERGY